MKMKGWIVAATLATIFTSVGAVMAQDAGAYWNGTHDPNLMQQYYTQGAANSATAALYPSPRPVPYRVGYSFNTYQPLLPHEMMWQHSRNYYNYYGNPGSFYGDPCQGGGCGNVGGGALNKTTVVWQSGCNHMGPLPFSMQPFARAHYNLASRYYCLDGNCGGAAVGGRLQGHFGHRHVIGDCANGNCGGY